MNMKPHDCTEKPQINDDILVWQDHEGVWWIEDMPEVSFCPFCGRELAKASKVGSEESGKASIGFLLGLLLLLTILLVLSLP